MSAIFTCRPNSHPFQERKVSVHEPIKIGRSVARARPSQTNAIFDCKVLSRNHALLWFENGQFFLQDTKSSNGTFINNQRLSKGSEESPPREIFSGDIVQFGVDVMENSRRETFDGLSANTDMKPVTHSCIIATVQLFHLDGREATNNHSSAFINAPGGPGLSAQSQELYQLSQYLQEALHREQMMESKLASLQRLVQNTQEASDSGWQALIDEDRLLSRLEVLENQLATYSKNQTEDTLRQELVALQEDKYNYETTAKESLRRVLQEKLEAVRKLSDLERSLSNTEDECGHLREMCETSQKELQNLAEKHQEQLQEISSLQEKLQDAEQKHQEEVENIELEKTNLQAKLEDMIQQEGLLQAKVESLQADNDFTKEQLANMKVKMEALRENGETPRILEQENQGVQVELVNLLDLKMLQGHSSGSDESDEEVDVIKLDVTRTSDRSESSADEKEKVITTIEDVLDSTRVCELNKVNGKEVDIVGQDTDADKDKDERDTLGEEELREKLKETQSKIEYYKTQLNETAHRLKVSTEKLEGLQGELEHARSETASQVAKITSLEERLQLSDVHMNEMVENATSDLSSQLRESKRQYESSCELVNQLKGQIAALEKQLGTEKAETVIATTVPVTGSPTAVHVNGTSPPGHAEQAAGLAEEVEKLKELLREAKESRATSEEQVNKYKGELEEQKHLVKKSTERSQLLQTQLTETQQLVKDKAARVSSLQDQLSKAEMSAKDVKHQIITLRDQLQESQQTSKQAKNEAEQLRMRLKSLQEELDFERSSRSVSSASSAHQEIQNQAAKNRVEFTSLKEECSSLRKRIQDIENEMKTSRQENRQLQLDYSKLQQSYTELELMKDKLENKETLWKLNMTEIQKVAEERNEELSLAQTKVGELSLDRTQLQAQIDDMEEEYGMLAYKIKTVSTCSVIPLIVLLFGIFMAFYPALSSVTATTSLDSL